MDNNSIFLVCEILEDAIHNKSLVPACKEKLLESLNAAELKTFVMAMVMQMDSDPRIKIVRLRNKKD